MGMRGAAYQSMGAYFALRSVQDWRWIWGDYKTPPFEKQAQSRLAPRGSQAATSGCSPDPSCEQFQSYTATSALSSDPLPLFCGLTLPTFLGSGHAPWENRVSAKHLPRWPGHVGIFPARFCLHPRRGARRRQRPLGPVLAAVLEQTSPLSWSHSRDV